MKKLIRVLCEIAMISLLVSCSKEKVVTDDQQVNIDNSQCITLAIDEIDDLYFLAQLPWPSPEKYKVLINLDDNFCEGDYVDVYYDELKETEDKYYEITALAVETSDFKLEEGVDYKPVIYLYPSYETDITVTLDYNGVLTHTYPIYSNGWNVTAYPDGILKDRYGKEYPYLFWEGVSNIEYDMTKGFCVTGDDTEQFLRTKLSFMGLNEKELEDFIDFWLPFMEKNAYNKICFQTTSYTENAKLIVNPRPDSILRIFMVFQPLNEFVEIEEQKLSGFHRTGFTLVEWGGSIKLIE
jgi:hypothetical protein